MEIKEQDILVKVAEKINTFFGLLLHIQRAWLTHQLNLGGQ